jgi:hypothetical protein
MRGTQCAAGNSWPVCRILRPRNGFAQWIRSIHPLNASGEGQGRGRVVGLARIVAMPQKPWHRSPVSGTM